MTSAKALAQMSGHAERDCADVLDACGGDVDRAIDRLLNSACDETARTGERGAAKGRSRPRRVWRLTNRDSRDGDDARRRERRGRLTTTERAR
jgi:hypothetical protein